MGDWTKGPWEILYGRGMTGRYDSDGDERFATRIGPLAPDHNHWDGWTLGVSYEDARLIAAAPELYEACERLLATSMGEGDRAEQIAARRQMRDAVAKARGDSNA